MGKTNELEHNKPQIFLLTMRFFVDFIGGLWYNKRKESGCKMVIKAGTYVWEILNGETIPSKIKSAKRESDGSIWFKLTSRNDIGTTDWLPDSIIGKKVFESVNDAEAECNRINKTRPRPFNVIDNKTGTYPDMEQIALKEDWAKGLMYCDMEGFFTGEDGTIILVDECGGFAYCPADRFTIVYE